MNNIDGVKEEATAFYDKYSKELDNKALFHKATENFGESKKP